MSAKKARQTRMNPFPTKRRADRCRPHFMVTLDPVTIARLRALKVKYRHDKDWSMSRFVEEATLSRLSREQ